MSTDNPLNYTSYDHDALVAQLTNRLKATNAWKDTYESSTGQMIIEFYAFVGNLVLFIIERRAEECFIDTAQNRSSILNLVKLINYSPKRKISAIGSLKFTLSAAHSSIVYVPKYTQCQTADGVKYLTNRAASILPGATSVTIGGVQGELITLLLTSDGTAGQEFTISDTAVEDSNYTVYIDDERWTEVSTFISSGNTSKHYRLVHELDDTLTLVFGDDIRGMVPSIGAVVKFEYIRSSGADGNVYQTDLITTLDDSIYDEDETVVSDISVTNSTTFTGGDNEEGMEEIRSEAPKVFSTGDRAVTRNDFIAILKNYPSIAEANVWGENEETSPDYDMFNTVKLCVILEDWKHPTDAFKTALATYLYAVSMLTVKYEFIEATFLDVLPSLDVLVNTDYALSAAQSDIETALAAQFVLGTTSQLGISKKYSNLVRVVDNLDSVNYHHMTLKIRKNLTATYESGYDYGETLDALPIKPGSVEIYADTDSGDDVLMARDDEAGEFTDLSSNYAVTGYINYTTGVVGVEFEPDTFISNVYVKYQQDEDGDIVPGEKQICKLYDVEITEIGYVSE